MTFPSQPEAFGTDSQQLPHDVLDRKHSILKDHVEPLGTPPLRASQRLGEILADSVPTFEPQCLCGL